MFKKISDILGHKPSSKGSQYYKKTSSEEFFDFLVFIRAWPKIVGPKLAKTTVPLKNQNKTLTILTNHSAYSQALSMNEEVLREKIFKEFPFLKSKVRSFKFIVDSTHFQKQMEDIMMRADVTSDQKIKKNSIKLHPQSPEYKKWKKIAEEEYKELEPELREKLVSIYLQMKLNS